MSRPSLGSQRLRLAMIYRQSRPGAHSIEELFKNISVELAKTDEVIEFHCRSRWAMLADALALRRLRPDIFHITGDVHYMALLLPRNRTVLTIHDLRSWSERLKGWRRWVFWLLWIRLPVGYAARLVAISDFVRDQIQAAANVKSERIKVIHNPVSPAFTPVEKAFNAARPTILHLGTDSNKNLERLIEAVASIRAHLSIVGRLSPVQEALLAKHRIDYSNHVDLNEKEVARRYAEADLVCFASLFEGFGMPIIEAQAVGRPVITSSREPMATVAGGAALLVDSTDVGEIRDAIQRLIESEDLRKELVAKGLLLSSERSTRAVVDSYRQIYLSLIPNP